MLDLHLNTSDLRQTKLGDGLLTASVFKAAGGNVRWHLNEGDLSDAYTWNRLWPTVEHHFEKVELSFGTYDPRKRVHILGAFKQIGRQLIEPAFTPANIEEPYFTSQYVARENHRTIREGMREHLAKKHGEGLKEINLDDSMLPLDEYFGIIAGAEFHLGINSAATWSARALKKQAKVMLNKEDVYEPWVTLVSTGDYATVVENKLNADMSQPKRIDLKLN